LTDGDVILSIQLCMCTT